MLGGLGLIGLGTILFTLHPAASGLAKLLWTVFLILFPIGLIGPVWMTWRWSAMSCIIYGTIGLALIWPRWSGLRRTQTKRCS